MIYLRGLLIQEARKYRKQSISLKLNASTKSSVEIPLVDILKEIKTDLKNGQKPCIPLISEHKISLTARVSQNRTYRG